MLVAFESSEIPSQIEELAVACAEVAQREKFSIPPEFVVASDGGTVSAEALDLV